MARFEAFGLGDERNVGMRRLCAVARPAEDLKVMGFVCAAKSHGKNVINVPRFAGVDLLSASCANAFPF
jgi:hypothetical protein